MEFSLQWRLQQPEATDNADSKGVLFPKMQNRDKSDWRLSEAPQLSQSGILKKEKVTRQFYSQLFSP